MLYDSLLGKLHSGAIFLIILLLHLHFEKPIVDLQETTVGQYY